MRSIWAEGYIKMQLQDNPLDKSWKNDEQSLATEGERNQVRRVVQSLMWWARQTRPDIMSPTTLLPRRSGSHTWKS